MANKDRIIVHVPTREEHEQLMDWLEQEGYRWSNGKEPRDFSNWESHKEDKGIEVGRLNKRILHGSVTVCRRGDFIILTLEQFFASMGLNVFTAVPPNWPF